MTEPVAQNFVIGLKRSSLEGRLIFACPHCQAPGVFHKSQHIREGWPGCFDPTRDQQPVGRICPNCKKPRSKDQDLGELKASLPLWVWKTVLGIKWLIVGARNIQGHFRRHKPCS
jgi:hypothetical protein